MKLFHLQTKGINYSYTPHKRHLSNDFVLDIGTLIQEAKEKSIYRKK